MTVRLLEVLAMSSGLFALLTLLMGFLLRKETAFTILGRTAWISAFCGGVTAIAITLYTPYNKAFFMLAYLVVPALVFWGCARRSREVWVELNPSQSVPQWYSLRVIGPWWKGKFFQRQAIWAVGCLIAGITVLGLHKPWLCFPSAGPLCGPLDSALVGPVLLLISKTMM